MASFSRSIVVVILVAWSSRVSGLTPTACEKILGNLTVLRGLCVVSIVVGAGPSRISIVHDSTCVSRVAGRRIPASLLKK